MEIIGEKAKSVETLGVGATECRQWYTESDVVRLVED